MNTVKSCKKLLLLKEEIYWRQSRVQYLTEGDFNTQFCHMRASLRKRRNLIKGVRNTEGVWVDSEEEIEKVAVEYFTKLFSSTNPTSFDGALDNFDSRVTSSMNEDLCAPFTRHEVYQALSQMNPTRALMVLMPIFFRSLVMMSLILLLVSLLVSLAWSLSITLEFS